MDILSEVLAIYDNPEKKHFMYCDVSGDIDKLDEDVRKSIEAKAEYMAMAFQDATGYEHWSTFYGPVTPGVTKDTGKEVCIPDYKDITPDMITYWEKRAAETKNPYLRMRYSGLVFDFKKKVTGNNKDMGKIIKLYTDSIVTVVKEDYMSYVMQGYCYIKRGMEMAKIMKNVALFEQCEDLLWDYNKKNATDDVPGYWGRQFNLFLDYIDDFSKYESKIIQENEERFDRIEKLAIDEGKDTDSHVHTLKDLAELLCQYYEKKGNREAVKSHLDRVLCVMRLPFEKRGAMWAVAMLQDMQALYRKFHFEKDANKLFLDFYDLGPLVLKGMQHHEFSVPIKSEIIKKYIEEFLAGSQYLVFEKFLIRHVPKLEEELQRQKEEVTQSPLIDLMRTTCFDYAGIPISNVGVGAYAKHQKLMHGMYRRLIIGSFSLNMIVEKLIEKGLFNMDFVKEIFKDNPVIAKDQWAIVERGMQAYFDKDYLVACHLLIPQFESAIRRVVAMNGGDILRSKANPQEGNEYISLDGLIESKEVKKAFGNDMYMYFKNLFVDQYGWNLRNLTSHGLLQAESFNSTMANRVVHAFMLLGLLKPTQIK